MSPDFDQPHHLIDQCREALLKVKHSDGWTDQALADLVAGMSRATVNSLTSDETRLGGPNALGYYLSLAKELWSRGNSRLVDVIRPPGVYDAYREPSHRPNGEIDDEVGDGMEALSRLRVGYNAGDPESMAEARKELRMVEERAEQEEAQLRERMAGATTLEVPGDGQPPGDRQEENSDTQPSSR